MKPSESCFIKPKGGSAAKGFSLIFGEDTIAAFFFLRFQFVLSMVRKDGSMRLFSYLSVAVLLVSGVVLTAYSPDLLSMVIVGFMCMITLAGCIYGLLPTISFTGGLLNGQNSIRNRRQLGMGRGAADRALLPAEAAGQAVWRVPRESAAPAGDGADRQRHR